MSTLPPAKTNLNSPFTPAALEKRPVETAQAAAAPASAAPKAGAQEAILAAAGAMDAALAETRGPIGPLATPDNPLPVSAATLSAGAMLAQARASAKAEQTTGAMPSALGANPETAVERPKINGLPLRDMATLGPSGRPEKLITADKIDSMTKHDEARVVYLDPVPTLGQLEKALRGTGLSALLVKTEGSNGSNLVVYRGTTREVPRGSGFQGTYSSTGNPMKGKVEASVNSFPYGEPNHVLGLAAALVATPINRGLMAADSTAARDRMDELVRKGNEAVELLRAGKF